MKNAEELISEYLNGKFFWEHTVTEDETCSSKNVLEIRKAQKKFAVNAANITSKNKNPAVYEKPDRTKRIVLTEDQEFLKPLLEAIAKVYNISVDDLLNRSTCREFAQAKTHLYWAVLKYNLHLGPREVGRILRKCRTTVMHGRTMFQKNQDFAKVVEVERLLGML